MKLNAECARVLGALVEKALTTPQQYPLTLNALVSACNQTSNRDPVVDYDEHIVKAALDELKELRLVRYVLPSHGRSVVRYRQVLEENLGLDARRCALLAMLLLRGPQTIGELRLRTDRMTQFDDLNEVTYELEVLAALEDPLTMNMGRRPGQKEERWASPLVLSEEGSPRSGSPVVPETEEWTQEPDRERSGVVALPLSDRVDQLSSELADLKSEVVELRRDLQTLRSNLGE